MREQSKQYGIGESSQALAVFGAWGDRERVHTVRVGAGRVEHRLEIKSVSPCPRHGGQVGCLHAVGRVEWVLIGKYAPAQEQVMVAAIEQLL